MNEFYKDKQQITNWLDKYQVKNYTLILDEKYGFVVDIDGDFKLNDKNLTNIPVKFNIVKGDFYCDNNPKLREIQNIFNFNLIYLEHKKLLAIINFAKKLDNDLSDKHNKKIIAIKI